MAHAAVAAASSNVRCLVEHPLGQTSHATKKSATSMSPRTRSGQELIQHADALATSHTESTHPGARFLGVQIGSARETLMPETRTMKAEFPTLPLLCAQPGQPDAFRLVAKIVSTPRHTVRFGKTGPVSPKRSRHLGRSTSGQTVSGEICRCRVNESSTPKLQPDTVGFHHGRSRAVAHRPHWLVCRCMEFGLPRSGKLTRSIHDSPAGIQSRCREAWAGADGFGDQPNHYDFSGVRPLSSLAAGVDRTGNLPCR